MANAQAVHGVLRVVKGDVQIKSAKTGQNAKARVGEKVFPKDTVITGKDARAKIVMVDNNEINVSPESQIEIQNYEYDPAAGKKDVLLNVIYGKVRSKVEQKYDGKTSKFQIKTPSAVAGVRGTDFLTGHVAGVTNVVTFEGKVEFGPPGVTPVTVTPGMTASVSGGTVTPPAPVPKTELAKMDNDTKADGPKNDTGNANDNRQPSANEKKEEKKEEKKDDAKKQDGPDKNKGAGNDKEGDKKNAEPAKQDGPDKNKGSGNDKNGNNGKGADNRGSDGGGGGSPGAPGTPSAGGSAGGGESASNGGGSGTSPGGTPSPDGGGRGPASNPTGPAAPGPVAGGCTMCGGPPMPTLPPVMPTLPPTFVPPPIFTPPPVCTACIDIPQSGASRLIIHVNTN